MHLVLVALTAAAGVGSWWFLAVASTPSKPTAPGPKAQGPSVAPSATTTPRPTDRTATASSAPLTLTASEPDRLAAEWKPSSLPGPILIADEAGSSPGYMSNPTGPDPYPPDSLLVRNAVTTGAVTH